MNYSQPKRTAGVTAQITCWPSSHFYLWGSNSTSCEKSLRWSGNYYRECLSKTQYEKQCRKVGGNVLYHGMQDGYLLCEKQGVYSKCCLGLYVPRGRKEGLGVSGKGTAGGQGLAFLVYLGS